MTRFVHRDCVPRTIDRGKELTLGLGTFQPSLTIVRQSAGGKIAVSECAGSSHGKAYDRIMLRALVTMKRPVQDRSVLSIRGVKQANT